jgi:hypothetical protein
LNAVKIAGFQRLRGGCAADLSPIGKHYLDATVPYRYRGLLGVAALDVTVDGPCIFGGYPNYDHQCGQNRDDDDERTTGLFAMVCFHW